MVYGLKWSIYQAKKGWTREYEWHKKGQNISPSSSTYHLLIFTICMMLCAWTSFSCNYSDEVWFVESLPIELSSLCIFEVVWSATLYVDTLLTSLQKGHFFLSFWLLKSFLIKRIIRYLMSLRRKTIFFCLSNKNGFLLSN